MLCGVFVSVRTRRHNFRAILAYVQYSRFFKLWFYLYLADILTGYFYSWRSYRMILARLRIKHGVKRRWVAYIIRGHQIWNICTYYYSLRWLKYRFKMMGLYRRGDSSLTPIDIVRNCIKVSYSDIHVHVCTACSLSTHHVCTCMISIVQLDLEGSWVIVLSGRSWWLSTSWK